MTRTQKRIGRFLTIIVPLAVIAVIVVLILGIRSRVLTKSEKEPTSSQEPTSSVQTVSSSPASREAASVVAESSAGASSAASAVSSGAEPKSAAESKTSSVTASVNSASQETASVVSSSKPASSAVQSTIPASSQATASKITSSQLASSQAVSSAAVVSKTASAGSFYANVTWRSPYAQTADIFKNGRELMLLNNYYELPENFQWNLVLWSNGQSVDALSLNNKASDKVQAVDAAAYQPLKEMFAAAKAAGVPLQLVSAYRSIDLQDRLFGSLVTQYMNQGMSKADAAKKANIQRTYTGTSEHNTGLGFDIVESGNYSLSQSFEKTNQFKWLSEHAAEYGFILRYSSDKVDKTGIMYEPWHYRYVGVENAQKIKASGLCLEEYIASLG